MATLRSVPAATATATVVQFVFGFNSFFIRFTTNSVTPSPPRHLLNCTWGMGVNVETRRIGWKVALIKGFNKLFKLTRVSLSVCQLCGSVVVLVSMLMDTACQQFAVSTNQKKRSKKFHTLLKSYTLQQTYTCKYILTYSRLCYLECVRVFKCMNMCVYVRTPTTTNHMLYSWKGKFTAYFTHFYLHSHLDNGTEGGRPLRAKDTGETGRARPHLRGTRIHSLWHLTTWLFFKASDKLCIVQIQTQTH